MKLNNNNEFEMPGQRLEVPETDITAITGNDLTISSGPVGVPRVDAGGNVEDLASLDDHYPLDRGDDSE